jgi:hypothetical protein
MSNKLATIVSDELIIAEVQLNRLKYIAMERLLSPDETKQYDILVKNIMLIKGQPTVINGVSNKVVEQLDNTELMKLAQLPDEEEPVNE